MRSVPIQKLKIYLEDTDLYSELPRKLLTFLLISGIWVGNTFKLGLLIGLLRFIVW